MGEIKRIENWSDGTIECLKCKKPIRLWWNGGELDQKECCGLMYRTEEVQVDLVISKADDVSVD